MTRLGPDGESKYHFGGNHRLEKTTVGLRGFELREEYIIRVNEAFIFVNLKYCTK